MHICMVSSYTQLFFCTPVHEFGLFHCPGMSKKILFTEAVMGVSEFLFNFFLIMLTNTCGRIVADADLEVSCIN